MNLRLRSRLFIVTKTISSFMMLSEPRLAAYLSKKLKNTQFKKISKKGAEKPFNKSIKRSRAQNLPNK